MPVSNAFSRGRGGGRRLAWLFWSGVGLAPLAALLLAVGQGTGPLRAAAVLAILAVIFIGLSVVFREDPADIREDLTDQIRREVDLVRRELGVVHRVLEGQLRRELDSVRGELELARREAVRGAEPLSLQAERLSRTSQLPGGPMRFIREISGERVLAEESPLPSSVEDVSGQTQQNSPPSLPQRSATVYAAAGRRGPGSETEKGSATGGPSFTLPEPASSSPEFPAPEAPMSQTTAASGLSTPTEPTLAWAPPAWDELPPPPPTFSSDEHWLAALRPGGRSHWTPEEDRTPEPNSRTTEPNSRTTEPNSRTTEPNSRTTEPPSRATHSPRRHPRHEFASVDHLPDPTPQGRHARRAGGRHAAPEE
jgi:hypothetical protein